jgi:putative membrane protein
LTERILCGACIGSGGFFWILAIVGVVWMINSIQQDRSTSSPSPPTRDRPLEALQRRYAEGEISTEEYEERKECLERDQ